MAKESISSFAGKRSFAAAFELTEALTQIQFKGAETGITTRVLNHWEGLDLIPNRRKDDSLWRRYSFVDFVWIRLMEQMRGFGMGLELIAKVKDMAMTPTDLIDLYTLMLNIGPLAAQVAGETSEEESQGYMDAWTKILSEDQVTVTLLQLLIATSIAKRCPIRLVVFLDGEVIWLEEHPEFVTPPDWTERMLNEPFISLSISGIIKEFLGSDLAVERIDELRLLNENENFLLKTIFSGEYDSITIKFKDQQLDSMEMKRSQDVKKKVIDVLAEADYQNITMVQHKGRVTRIENTIKHRFDKPKKTES